MTKNVVEDAMPKLRLFSWMVWLACLSAAGAQEFRPETTVGAVLRSLTQRASVAFVGQVERIERKRGVVEIEFRVDQTVLGDAGGEFVLREWAGLWPPGQSRYVVGQRAMVFVHGGGRGTGMSSPVDGMEGVVPVLVRDTDAAPLLDVRRLQARLQRAKGEPLRDGGTGAVTLRDGARVVAEVRRGKNFEPALVPLPDGADVDARR